MLEASLEVTLGGEAGEALTRRILEAARREGLAGPKPRRPARPRRGRRVRRRSAAPLWLAAVAGIAAAALLVLWLAGPREEAPQGPRAGDSARLGPGPELVEEEGPESGPELVEGPEPEPVEQPGPVEGPEPEPEPAPELVEGPEPGPEPVEGPEPELVEGPEPPEPRESGPTVVEQPEPSVAPTALATVTVAGRGLAVREGDDWRELEQGAPVFAGSALRARGASAIRLGGARLSFEGELALEGDADAPVITLEDDDLYVDNLAAATPLTVVAGSHQAVLADGSLFLEKSGSTVLFACLAGEAALPELTLAAGESVKARRARLGAVGRVSADDVPEALLALAGGRVAWVEEFDTRPAGWERGEVADGYARCAGDGSGIEFDLPAPLALEPGMRIRIRLRAEGVEQLVFQTLEHDESRNYRTERAGLPEGFHEWTISCAELFATVERDAPMPEAARLRNLQLHIYGADPRLTVDRIVFLRE